MENSRVLFVTSEIDDLVRVGGLAAVSAALPRALSKLYDIRVLLPGYPAVLAKAQPLEMVGRCAPYASLPECGVGRFVTADGLQIYVLLSPALYEREGSPYGDANGVDWSDNDIRFGRLSAAAVDLALGLVDPDWSANLVHANDWPSALVPAYLNWRESRLPSVLTLHNLAYQGLFPRESLGRLGAPESAFHPKGVEFYNQFSFLKAGIIYASHVTTVSDTYAREITTPEYGCGLDGLLRERASRSELTGIVNGIDESWNPGKCPDLIQRFESGDWRGKRANADHVRKAFGLAVSKGPLFSLVARLVHQKGVDLVLSAAETIISAGGQIIVTGTGERRFETALREANRKFPNSIGVAIGFDDIEARRIFAGSDFTLMPSRFEPCGLSQMYAQRLGSLPIGHRTGGLADTIDDGKTGFLFGDPTVEGFLQGVCRAFATFGSKRAFNGMRRNAMAQSFAWQASVSKYSSLYGRISS